MMSPNNCIKISKDQGSTHVQKHREVDLDDINGPLSGTALRRHAPTGHHELQSSNSGSPSTNYFIRKPSNGLDRREDLNVAKFGSLKKGNLFGGSDALERSFSTDDDFDADVDADENANRRIRDQFPSDNALALKKSFTFDRNYKQIRRGSSSSANGTDHESQHQQQETDAGTESDFSGVAGKMSTLSVGKRSSGFSIPTRRGSPGTSPPSSQNSSMNSSCLGHSPALQYQQLQHQHTGARGTQGLMEDLLSADASGSPHAQLNFKGHGLFPNETLPSRSLRSRANRLISNAIFNNNLDHSSHTNSAPAATPVAPQKSSASLLEGSAQSNSSVLHGSGSSSANNTHINQYHAAAVDGSRLSNRSDHTDALYNSATSSTHTSELHDRSELSNISVNSSSNGSGDNNRYHRRHPQQQQGDVEENGEDEHLALGRSIWGEEALHQQHHLYPSTPSVLPPRTPLVHKQHAHTVHHQQKHAQSHHHLPHSHLQAQHENSGHGKSLTRIEEGEAPGPAASNSTCSVGAITYDASGSPVLTPSRGSRRRRAEGTHSHSQSASMSMSQQSVGHEEAMGDLGTPVAEVGSPVVLDDMDDLVGEEDEEDEQGSDEEDEEVYAWVDSNEKKVKDGSRLLVRGVPAGSLKRDEDDPELVMITAVMRGSDSHEKQLQHRRRRRKTRSPFSATSTAGPKGKLFQDDDGEGEEGVSTPQQQLGLSEDDHQYHLFAQQFMVSPTLEEAIDEPHRQYKYHRSSEDHPDGGGDARRQDRQLQQHGLDDTLFDSPSSLDSSAASGNAGSRRGNVTGVSDAGSFSRSSSLSLTRTNSDMGASMNQHRTSLGMNLTRSNSDTFSLSRSDCNNTSTHTGSSSAFLPLPDQSAFDGAGQADLSRSSYDLHLSSSHNSSVDPLFPTPGSARKKRPVQQLGGSPCAAVPPSPLRGLEWGLLGSMGSPSAAAERKHHLHVHPHHGLHGVSQEAHDQLNASSSSSTATTPNALNSAGMGAQGGIAMHQLLRHHSSEGSVESEGSHDSDIIIAHHWQRKAADGKGSKNNSSSALDALSYGESKDPFHFISHNPRLPQGHKSGTNSHSSSHSRLPYDSEDSPSDSFSSLSAGRPALVRQSSLLDTKLLLVAQQAESVGPTAAHAAVVSFREDFEEVGLLGSGTFADVYKVRQVTPGSDPEQYFAVKKSKQQFKSKRDREWLMAEVRTMKLVGQGGCPYVVPFIRAWQEDCYFYVQMGFAERGTLRELLLHLARRSTSTANSSSSNNAVVSTGSYDALVPDSAVWQVVHDVTAGLHHIHSCGMVHLDIKPANLLITAEGRVQIGDFGMAAPIDSSDDGREGDTR